MPDTKRLTTDALLVLFAGLSGGACAKTAPEARPEKPATQASSAPAVQASGQVEAKEVAAPAPSGSGAQKGCAPGGCAPGACGGSEKK